ncbi:MAG: UDP-N-acetylmuramoyl-L-alanine--D-glutamate ligase [Candidatus Edwardsbacteria bacterium]|nr:UDP-N-acetylmuramoyl-L-alanine--D-glutamate ligase [Candidatus Edwardsbacteria bacterium]
MPFDFSNIKACVIGAGRSGRAAVKLLRARGASVFVSERNPASPELMEELNALGAGYEFGGNTAKILGNSLIVISPGVRTDLPIVEQARWRNIRIISEIELAYLATEAPIVAVTGTNGKSTTASMIGEILQQAGIHTLTGGNLAPGRPLAELALEAKANSVIVAEVSTFQIETIEDFKPHVAVITNISPDHLDRHPDFETYAALKGRLLKNQTGNEYAVLNADDANVEKYTVEAKATKLMFSVRRKQANGAWFDNKSLRLARDGRDTVVMRADELKVPGIHNVENALAAIVSSSVFGVQPGEMRTALSEFAGVPHRLEMVRTVNGVTYINNSMCTNAAAGVSSLRAIDQPLVVIAGGRDKGLDLSPFLKEIKQRARAAVFIGEISDRLASELKTMGFDNIHTASDLDQAVRIASGQARPGDTVILSPCCSSFDMFRDFEDRGDRFKRIVRELA